MDRKVLDSLANIDDAAEKVLNQADGKKEELTKAMDEKIAAFDGVLFVLNVKVAPSRNDVSHFYMPVEMGVKIQGVKYFCHNVVAACLEKIIHSCNHLKKSIKWLIFLMFFLVL